MFLPCIYKSDDDDDETMALPFKDFYAVIVIL